MTVADESQWVSIAVSHLSPLVLSNAASIACDQHLRGGRLDRLANLVRKAWLQVRRPLAMPPLWHEGDGQVSRLLRSTGNNCSLVGGLGAAIQFFLGYATLAAILLSLIACGSLDDEEFKARNTLYRFPSEAVVSVTFSPHRTIRLAPPGERFDLVFDSRIDDQVDGKGYPKVFSINDGPLFAKTYRSTTAGVVVCRPSFASMECGMALDVDGEHWSMLFPPMFKSDAVAMAARASAYIRASSVPETGSRS